MGQRRQENLCGPHRTPAAVPRHARVKPSRWLAAIVVSASLSAVAAVLAEDDATRDVHDPVVIRERDTYYLFCSGRGVPVRRSRDLFAWERIGCVFDEDVPAWAKAEIPAARDVWAPDISFYNGRFHLYYAVSTMGSQRSCIGVATNRTLDPASPDYRWVDHGKVIESFPDKVDYNAIDANLARDERGDPWLVWGSFWTGIKLMRLDAATGKPSKRDGRIHALAARPGNTAIEAPFLVRKDGYYYLFVSFDQCCRGVASNYKILVGRSQRITGPYTDYNGRPMLEGHATLVLAGYGPWRGPGHNGILLEKAGDWIVHHVYDARLQGAPTLQVRPLLWSADGWPVAGEPLTAPATTRPALRPDDLLGAWRHSVNFGAEEYIELHPGGRMNAAVMGATWSLDGKLLRLRWPMDNAPGGAWVDTCFIAPDGQSYVGRNQRGDLTRGMR